MPDIASHHILSCSENSAHFKCLIPDLHCRMAAGIHSLSLSLSCPYSQPNHEATKQGKTIAFGVNNIFRPEYGESFSLFVFLILSHSCTLITGINKLPGMSNINIFLCMPKQIRGFHINTEHLYFVCFSCVQGKCTSCDAQ